MAIELTDRAVQALSDILEQEVKKKTLKPDAVVRFMVVGGGCSGFSYKLGFDESVSAEHELQEVKGVKIAVDQKSRLYLDGVKVDFHDGLMGKGFVFENPNASGSCGCGESFSI